MSKRKQRKIKTHIWLEPSPCLLPKLLFSHPHLLSTPFSSFLLFSCPPFVLFLYWSWLLVIAKVYLEGWGCCWPLGHHWALLHRYILIKMSTSEQKTYLWAWKPLPLKLVILQLLVVWLSTYRFVSISIFKRYHSVEDKVSSLQENFEMFKSTIMLNQSISTFSILMNFDYFMTTLDHTWLPPD